MLKLTKTGIGLLTRQYRSVLKKCRLINVGLFTLSAVILPRDANAGFGFLDREIRADSWGVLNQGGYSNYFQYSSNNGAAFAMAEKTGGPEYQLSIQIDGYFYQNEGNYRVLDTSDIIYSVTSGSGKVATSGAVASALAGKQATIDDLATIRSNAAEGAAKVSANSATITITANGVTKTFDTNQGTAATLDFGSTDLSNYYTKSETYSKDQINNIQSLNNYYRKNEKSEILNGFEEGEKGNEIGDNFSKFRADNDNFATNNGDFASKNGDFASNNLSRLGAFSKCEKACPRPSERFPASLEKNSAFEQYSRSARGTFLFVFPTHKNVLDNFYKNSQCLKASNDNFATTTFLRAI